jgi:hypothetical protein
MEYTVIVHSNQEKLEQDLNYCKERFGHRGRESGWWWKVSRKWKDGKFVFSFEHEQDALAFKLARGS